MAKKAHSSAASRKVEGLATPVAALTGLEPAAIKMLADLGAKHGPALGQALYNAIRRAEAVFFRFDASWKQGNYYYVVTSVHNLTEHGVYLENLWVHEPPDTPLDVARYSSDTAGFAKRQPEADVWKTPKEFFPYLLPMSLEPGIKLVLRLTDYKKPGGEGFALASRDSVIAEYSCSPLGGTAPAKPRKITLRIRHSGPPF